MICPPVQLHHYRALAGGTVRISHLARHKKRSLAFLILIIENRLALVLRTVIIDKVLITAKGKALQSHTPDLRLWDDLGNLHEIPAVRNQNEDVLDGLIRQGIVGISGRDRIEGIKFLLFLRRPGLHQITGKPLLFAYIIAGILGFLDLPVKADAHLVDRALDPLLLGFHHGILGSAVHSYHRDGRRQKDQKIGSQKIQGDPSFPVLIPLFLFTNFPLFHLLTHPVFLISAG